MKKLFIISFLIFLYQISFGQAKMQFDSQPEYNFGRFQWLNKLYMKGWKNQIDSSLAFNKFSPNKKFVIRNIGNKPLILTLTRGGVDSSEKSSYSGNVFSIILNKEILKAVNNKKYVVAPSDSFVVFFNCFNEFVPSHQSIVTSDPLNQTTTHYIGKELLFNSNDSSNKKFYFYINGIISWELDTPYFLEKSLKLKRLNYFEKDTIYLHVIQPKTNTQIGWDVWGGLSIDIDLISILPISQKKAIDKFPDTIVYRIVIYNIYGNIGKFGQTLFLKYNYNLDKLPIKIEGELVGKPFFKNFLLPIYGGVQYDYDEQNKLKAVTSFVNIKISNEIRSRSFYNGKNLSRIESYGFDNIHQKWVLEEEEFDKNGKVIFSKSHEVPKEYRVY